MSDIPFCTVRFTKFFKFSVVLCNVFIVFSSVVSHGRRQVMISHLFSTACICIHIHAAPGAIHGQLFYVSTYLACRRPCPHLTCRRLPPYLICCHLFRNSIRNVVLLVFLFPSPFSGVLFRWTRQSRGACFSPFHISHRGSTGEWLGMVN